MKLSNLWKCRHKITHVSNFVPFKDDFYIEKGLFPQAIHKVICNKCNEVLEEKIIDAPKQYQLDFLKRNWSYFEKDYKQLVRKQKLNKIK